MLLPITDELYMDGEHGIFKKLLNVEIYQTERIIFSCTLKENPSPGSRFV